MGSTLSSMNSNPLFSVFVSFYVIVILYAPRLLFRLLFSPVFLSTGIILAGILHLGKNQKPSESPNPEPLICLDTTNDRNPTESPESEPHLEDGECWDEEEKETEVFLRREQQFSDIFVEWHRRAPLEVIYEEYEGEEDEEGGNSPEYYPPVSGRDGAYSLELCYSESESSSDGGFPVMEEWQRPENSCFRFEEDKDDGLIEIPIFVGKDTCRSERLLPTEEDNLIEIDLFHQTVLTNPNFPARIQAATQC